MSMEVTPTPSLPHPSGPPASGMKVLVLTVIAAFMSVFVGGCTAAVGHGLSEMDQRFGDGSDVSRLRDKANGQAGFGVTQAIIAVCGGIMAFRNYNSQETHTYAGRSIKKLTVAGIMLLVAAAMSISNVFTFITAGVLNGVAAALTLARSSALSKPG